MEAKRALIGQTPQMLPQRFALRILALLITAFCVATMFYSLSFYGYSLVGINGADAEDPYLQSWPTRNFEVARRCSRKLAKTCYSVIDVIDEASNTARRVLLTNGLAEVESMVPLVAPKGMSTKNSDTRLWQIDHSKISCQYQVGMVAAAFAVGALRPPQPPAVANAPPASTAAATKSKAAANAALTSTSNEAKQTTAVDESDELVMIVGLGGGTMDMFLNRRFPKMNITVWEIDPLVAELARDWFDVRESANRRTIIGDGIEALRNASAKNELYNVVFLDACNLDAELPCPSSQFLRNSTLAQIKSILRPMGVFVTNVLPLQNECRNLQKIYQQLTAHFPICAVTHLTEESNTIFACLPYGVPAGNLASLGASWKKAWSKGVHALGFDDALQKVARFEVAPEVSGFQREKFGHAPACGHIFHNNT